jgi:hypothetical protein
MAELSPAQTLDAIYESSAGIRLEMIYSPTIRGELRKRWAHRLGGINLLAPPAADEIQALREELALYAHASQDCHHLDIARIRRDLRRLRELCRRYQALAKAPSK